MSSIHFNNYTEKGNNEPETEQITEETNNYHSDEQTTGLENNLTKPETESKESQDKELEKTDDQHLDNISAKEDAHSATFTELGMILDTERRLGSMDAFSLGTSLAGQEEANNQDASSRKASSVEAFKELFRESSEITSDSFIHDGSLDAQSLVTQIVKAASQSTVVSKPATPFLSKEEPIEEPPIDKHMYYNMYDTFHARIREEKLKNEYLQRKLVHYYRKRKMLHVIAKDLPNEDAEKKYHRELEQLDRRKDALSREQLKINNESQSLRNKCRHQSQEVDNLWTKFQNGELEFAKEFADADPIRDSLRKAVVERCLRSQRIQRNNLRKIRLSYIKGRNMLQETQDALDSLDNLGPHLRLSDYEQLKHDNRNLKDKLEEKVLELIRIRTKCQNTMQILAHIREKIAGLNTQIDSLCWNIKCEEDNVRDIRYSMQEMKQEKDELRKAINKFKTNSGLMFKPDLLADMENTMSEIKTLSEAVTNYKMEYGTLLEKEQILKKREKKPSRHVLTVKANDESR